ncbi:hypothetical protein MKW94_029239 [Papaver nudicaule]|uniref:Uncharacterized protein n=1 Tax=Papaver nudicaule TaxID=74823 RepID=A0AA42B1G8_PAPNU|nr:hypothetical protein [Papaver nudicaule]
MAKRSSLLVIGFFVVVLVVLQSAYVSGAGDYGQCYAYMQVDIHVSSCDECAVSCSPALATSTCVSDSAVEGAYVCECCARVKSEAHEEHMSVDKAEAAAAVATPTTSIPFLSVPLFLSFILNMLFN